MNQRRRDYRKARRKFRRKTRSQEKGQADWQAAQDQAPGLGFDAGLDREMSDIQTDADRSRSNLVEQRGTLFNQYFDPNNPFSQQALLEKQITDQRQGRVGNYASRGRLYSGGLEHAMQGDARNALQARDSMNRGYASQVTGAERANADTLRGLTRQGEDAVWNRAQQMGANIQDTAVPSAQALGMGKKPKKPKRKDFGLPPPGSNQTGGVRFPKKKKGKKNKRSRHPNDSRTIFEGRGIR